MREKKRAVVLLLVFLCAAAAATAIFWKNGGVSKPSAASDPEPGAVPTAAATPEPRPVPTAAPVEETPEPTPRPTEEPAASEISVGERNAAACEELSERFAELGGDLAYVGFFGRRTEGVFAQQGGNFTIGLPLNYADEPMDLIFYFDPGFFPVYGQSRYLSTDTVNYYFQEDIVDTIMDNNPDTVVVALSSDNSIKVLSYMLHCLQAIGVSEYETVICSGWSAGGNYALNCAAYILRDYPELGSPVIVLNDCNHTPSVDWDIYDTLEGSEVKCLVFSTMEHAVTDHKLYRLAGCALPIAVIHVDLSHTDDFNTHVQRRILAVTDNVYGYVLGTIPELSGTQYNASYRYGYHDYDTKDTVWSTAQDVYAMFFENRET